MLLALLTDYGAGAAQYNPGGPVNELTGHEDVNNFQQGVYVHSSPNVLKPLGH